MKKQTLLLTAFTSVFVLAGCSSQPAKNKYQTQQEPVVAKQAPIVEPKAVPEVAKAEKEAAKPEAEKAPKMVYKVPKSALEPKLIKISGIGYGAESTFEGYTPGQRRLMAIRSAKLDAYRSLAEQLYGIKIDSNTSVATLTAQNDSFRARVNAIVRGARIVSITPMADHNYETVLEVYVDQSFFKNAFVYTHKTEETTISAEDLCRTLECQAVGDR